jgi:hypothetical protein
VQLGALTLPPGNGCVPFPIEKASPRLSSRSHVGMDSKRPPETTPRAVVIRGVPPHLPLRGVDVSAKDRVHPVRCAFEHGRRHVRVYIGSRADRRMTQ